jgi:hypothetical protein
LLQLGIVDANLTGGRGQHAAVKRQQSGDLQKRGEGGERECREAEKERKCGEQRE